MGTESNFPLPKFVTLGGDCIDGNISGRFDNADGVIGFTLDISEPDESEDVFVADGVGERGEVGVEDGTGVADGLGNCPAPQPEIHMPRTKMETIAIHAFVFIFLFSDSASRAAQRFALLALGRAWTMFGSRKNSKPEKCSKMPQNPQRPVHALLGRFCKTVLNFILDSRIMVAHDLPTNILKAENIF